MRYHRKKQTIEMTSFIEAVSDGMKKFLSTSGRTTRSGYWWFVLFFVAVMTLVVLMLIGKATVNSSYATAVNLIVDVSFWYLLIVPGIRRLHDIDRSPANALWVLVPVIGWIYLIYLYCLPSVPQEFDIYEE